MEKIQVKLLPLDGAEKCFKTGQSEKRSYLPAYTKNLTEKYKEYTCPPRIGAKASDKNEGQEYIEHRVKVEVPVRGFVFFERIFRIPIPYIGDSKGAKEWSIDVDPDEEDSRRLKE